jgi:tRNA-specific 2-thiouridylase
MLKKKIKVAVAMSGGVDSSVAAALLIKNGYEVVGFTMIFKVSGLKTRPGHCFGVEAVSQARRAAAALQIKHYVYDLSVAMEKKVLSDFSREYARGRTPNPCVRCNEFIKFGCLLDKAGELGAQFIATGHYARIANIGKTHCLLKARDRHKDQSYFLYRLDKEKLKKIIFPLGNYNKKQVRGIAAKMRLAAADSQDSQEICFIRGSYMDFLRSRSLAGFKAGTVLDGQGNVLGQHRGIASYTIGQRQGLGIARGYPLYVSKIDTKNNTITLGEKKDLLNYSFLAGNVILFSRLEKKAGYKVRIRHLHKEAPAEVCLTATKLKVNFKKPQFAITPGQSAVIYDKDRVIGGGIIEKILD